MSKKALVEICCGSADDALEAGRAGIRRIELSSGMLLGGLTPSRGALRVARRSGAAIMAMVRPREGGFHYTQAEFESMLLDARDLLDAGAKGIVFGILREDGRVDAERCAVFMQALQGATAVFHRAIDVTPDWREALDTLIDLGIQRVLTSGQAPSAPEGLDTLQAMVAHAAGRIEILPGGGIRPHNLRAVLAATGSGQIHATAHSLRRDASTRGNPLIHFGAAGYSEEEYKMVDIEKVRLLLAAADE